MKIAGEKTIDFSKVLNENCGQVREIPISSTELQIKTQNIDQTENVSVPSVKIELGKIYISTLKCSLI